jgi:hypothetical protein
MRVIFHPEFPKDIRRFEADYATISDGLATRFRQEIARSANLPVCAFGLWLKRAREKRLLIGTEDNEDKGG